MVNHHPFFSPRRLLVQANRRSRVNYFEITVTQQLNDGIRMLQMQAHMQDDVIHLCHSSCILYDGGTLEDYLTKGTPASLRPF